MTASTPHKAFIYAGLWGLVLMVLVFFTTTNNITLIQNLILYYIYNFTAVIKKMNISNTNVNKAFIYAGLCGDETFKKPTPF